MPPLPTTLGDPLRPILSESERMQQALRTVLGAGQPEDAEQHLRRKYHTDAEFHAAVYLAAQMHLRAEDADQAAWDGIAAMRSPWAGTIGMLGRPTTDGRRVDELLLLNPVPLVAARPATTAGCTKPARAGRGRTSGGWGTATSACEPLVTAAGGILSNQQETSR